MTRLLRAELTKAWRSRFPYMGLAAAAVTALLARQSANRFGSPGEISFSSYLVFDLNLLSTATVPIFSTVFTAMLVAGETNRGTLRMILPRPVARAQFLHAKLLTGLIYMLLLFLANLAIALPIASTYPLRAAIDEDLPVPGLGSQLATVFTGIGFTLIPHAATVCFAFLVSVLSRNVASAIGVTVGILFSLLPIQVFLKIGEFDLGDYFFSSYYDKATAVINEINSSFAASWNNENIQGLLLTSLVSAPLLLITAYLVFTRRDLNGG